MKTFLLFLCMSAILCSCNPHQLFVYSVKKDTRLYTTSQKQSILYTINSGDTILAYKKIDPRKGVYKVRVKEFGGYISAAPTTYLGYIPDYRKHGATTDLITEIIFPSKQANASSEWTSVEQTPSQKTIKPKINPRQTGELRRLTSVERDKFSAGVTIGYHLTNAAVAGLVIRPPRSMIHLSLSFQSGGEGKYVKERLSNYGLTVRGQGTYFDALNIGYAYKFTNWLYLGAEYSVGWMKNYTSYVDNRFTEGGYWMIDNKRTVSALGVTVAVPLSSQFNLQGGYNSLTGVRLGCSYILNPDMF